MHRHLFGFLNFALAVTFSTVVAGAQSNPRARDLGIPFDGTPGPLNAMTDVEGVEVGHATLISGEGALEVGEGPVRTGVTVDFPKDDPQRTRSSPPGSRSTPTVR